MTARTQAAVAAQKSGTVCSDRDLCASGRSGT